MTRRILFALLLVALGGALATARPPRGAVPPNPAPFAAYPASEALQADVAWHRQVGDREVRLSWFLHGDPVDALLCRIDLNRDEVRASGCHRRALDRAQAS